MWSDALLVDRCLPASRPAQDAAGGCAVLLLIPLWRGCSADKERATSFFKHRCLQRLDIYGTLSFKNRKLFRIFCIRRSIWYDMGLGSPDNMRRRVCLCRDLAHLFAKTCQEKAEKVVVCCVDGQSKCVQRRDVVFFSHHGGTYEHACEQL